MFLFKSKSPTQPTWPTCPQITKPMTLDVVLARGSCGASFVAMPSPHHPVALLAQEMQGEVSATWMRVSGVKYAHCRLHHILMLKPTTLPGKSSIWLIWCNQVRCCAMLSCTQTCTQCFHARFHAQCFVPFNHFEFSKQTRKNMSPLFSLF